jgi:hypothetical protein
MFILIFFMQFLIFISNLIGMVFVNLLYYIPYSVTEIAEKHKCAVLTIKYYL